MEGKDPGEILTEDGASENPEEPSMDPTLNGVLSTESSNSCHNTWSGVGCQ